jgi:hypothetical protein
MAQVLAHVLADEAWATALAVAEQPDIFVERLVADANARGVGLNTDDAYRAIQPDPLGIARFVPTPPDGSQWPPRHWLPVGVVTQSDGVFVDWLRFGPEPLTEPFFEQSIRSALFRPFNRMFRYRMTLGDFIADARHQQTLGSGLPPRGFIFHMSRCGSTLVTRMLAALTKNIVISEAAPIDGAVQLGRMADSADLNIEILRAMILAFTRPRAGNERHAFFKLDCWHALSLPLFERAFPNTPWLFLYRDPVEVMVSQMRERGTQMVPAFLSLAEFGIDGSGIPDDDYCAQVLGRICTAAADRLAARGSRGLAINYRELPDALPHRILPHVGVVYSPAELETMRRVTRYDAKLPQMKFASDGADKQQSASSALRAATEHHLGAAIRRLESLNPTP